MAQTYTHSAPLLPLPVTAPQAGLYSQFQKPVTPFAYYNPLQNHGTSEKIGQNQNPAQPTVSAKEKEKLAWKYVGYKGFSKWMASEDDFFVFRRFGKLNAGAILWMQDRISHIETRLEQIHEEIADSQDGYQRNSSFRWDIQNQPERDELMAQLTGLLHHYNQYIEAYSKVRTRPKAELRQIQNVHKWLKGGAINPEERKPWLDHEGDLIAVNTRSRPPLLQLLEASRLLRLSGLLREKLSPDVHVISDHTHYSSNELFEQISCVSIILLGFMMMLGPLWWLNFVSDSRKRLGIITGFIAVFMLLMTCATVNRPFEVVASSAAYAAVLMVFMQIGGK